MKGETFRFISEDKVEISAMKWLPEKDIKAVLLINHGMEEHISRYEDFALFLNKAGIAVWGEDHRGHGETAGNLDNLGYFDIERGWEKVLSDIFSLKEMIISEYPDKPFFILGHSMGSFLTRDFLCDHGENISGAILSGTGYKDGITCKVLRSIARNEIKRFGDRHRSTFLEKLSFDPYSKQFKPNRTTHDWLSRDNKQVDLYINDPYCGVVSTSSFYEDLADGLIRIIDNDRLGRTPKDLPMLFYSGDEDPVGGKNGKGVIKTAALYQKLGHTNIKVELNPGGRHESLNETNRDEVYNRFLRFIESNISS